MRSGKWEAPLVEDAVELALQNVRTLALDLQLIRAPLCLRPPTQMGARPSAPVPMQIYMLSFVSLPTGGSARPALSARVQGVGHCRCDGGAAAARDRADG